MMQSSYFYVLKAPIVLLYENRFPGEFNLRCFHPVIVEAFNKKTILLNGFPRVSVRMAQRFGSLANALIAAHACCDKKVWKEIKVVDLATNFL